MEDWFSLSKAERAKIMRDEERKKNGKRLLKAIGFALGGTGMAIAATMAGLDETAITMPIIIGSGLAGKYMTDFFASRSIEKKMKYDEIINEEENKSK